MILLPNSVTSCHSKAMNKENGVVVASRGQDCKGFKGIATGNALVLLENGLVKMGFDLLRGIYGRILEKTGLHRLLQHCHSQTGFVP